MSKYFRELTLNLQHAGFVVKPETDEGLLPVELGGQRLCRVYEPDGCGVSVNDQQPDGRL